MLIPWVTQGNLAVTSNLSNLGSGRIQIELSVLGWMVLPIFTTANRCRNCGVHIVMTGDLFCWHVNCET
jgi:hypothetical protein